MIVVVYFAIGYPGIYYISGLPYRTLPQKASARQKRISVAIILLGLVVERMLDIQCISLSKRAAATLIRTGLVHAIVVLPLRIPMENLSIEGNGSYHMMGTKLWENKVHGEPSFIRKKQVAEQLEEGGSWVSRHMRNGTKIRIIL